MSPLAFCSSTVNDQLTTNGNGSETTRLQDRSSIIRPQWWSRQLFFVQLTAVRSSITLKNHKKSELICILLISLKVLVVLINMDIYTISVKIYPKNL